MMGHQVRKEQASTRGVAVEQGLAEKMIFG